MTYSIVARDAASGALGFASQTHFFGVGRLVGWGEPGLGAVATQAFVNVGYGPGALAGLRAGGSPETVVDRLTAADPFSAYRQLGIVDAQGRSASYTGDRCAPAAAGITKDGVAVQGNMLGSDEVPSAMLQAYEAAPGDLADRLLAAMTAAEDAGGDIRGSQSAVLKVYSGEASAEPWNDVIVDIRVDDHPDPVAEVARLLPRHRAFDVISSVIFAPGLMIGPFEGVSGAQVAERLGALAEASRTLGPDNREAAFWHALLQARRGEAAEARTAFADLFRERPQLRRFLEGIAPLGFLDDPAEYLG